MRRQRAAALPQRRLPHPAPSAPRSPTCLAACVRGRRVARKLSAVEPAPICKAPLRAGATCAFCAAAPLRTATRRLRSVDRREGGALLPSWRPP
eukprot:757128-Alexandrium_andersonii.AAC.1